MKTLVIIERDKAGYSAYTNDLSIIIHGSGASVQEAMYSGGYPFSVPVIPVHFLGVKTDYLLRS